MSEGPEIRGEGGHNCDNIVSSQHIVNTLAMLEKMLLFPHPVGGIMLNGSKSFGVLEFVCILCVSCFARWKL